MNSKEVIEILDKVIDGNEDPISILINGSWGIGKTHIIKEWLDSRKETSKVVYISLFGKEDIKDIEKDIILKIKGGIFEVLNNSSKKVNGKVGFNAIKKLAKDKFSIDLDLSSYISDIYVNDLENEENVIVCIDDLERISEDISMKSMMGLIERISEKFNIITIVNLLKLKKIEEFNSYKEKVIDFEFEINNLDDKLLNEIIKNKLNDLELEKINLIRDTFIFKNNIDISIKENKIIYNIRIYKKYVDLIKRVHEESNKILNNNKFILDQTLINICKDVVLEYYSDTAKSEKKVNRYDKDLFLSIYKIFSYENYKEDTLKEYLLNNSQISYDIKVLNNMFNISLDEIETVLSRIENNIENENVSYFVNQRKIIHLYDTLLSIKYKTDYKEKLLNIAKKLYKINVLDGYKSFDKEDWIDFKYNDIIPCGIEVSRFINSINGYNLNAYNKLLIDTISEALKCSDTSTLMNVLRILPRCRIDIFIPIFEFCLDGIDKGGKGEYWNIISKLLNLANFDDVIKYLKEKVNIEESYIAKARLREIICIVDEYNYENNLNKAMEEWEKEH